MKRHSRLARNTGSLAQVHADDELLDHIGSGQPGLPNGLNPRDAHLAALLAGWRAEVHRDAVGELLSPATAHRAIQAGRHRKPRPPRKWPWRWTADFVRMLIPR